MKFINRHKIILFLRIFFCGFLVTIWVFWLTNLPKPEKALIEKVKQKVEDKKINKNNDLQKEDIESKELKAQITFLGNESAVIKSKDITKPTPTAQNKVTVGVGFQPKAGPPLTKKPASTAPTTTPNTSSTPAISKKIDSVIKLPKTASATRKILLNNKPVVNSRNANESVGETTLRKEIHIDMTSQKPILSKTLENSHEESIGENWLPKYVLETKEITQKIENTNNNLDQIASQLELTGLIENPNGEKSAIFKNRLNNQTEILKQGQEYLNLTVTEITQDQVILENISLNKKYIKTIDSR